MIAIILVFVLYYITFGVLTSYLGSKIFKRANMKATGFVTFLYGLLWPFFLKHIIPGIKDIICKDATQAAVKETVEYIEKREELKELEAKNLIRTTNTLVGNDIDPNNIKIPDDAIPINKNSQDEENIKLKENNGVATAVPQEGILSFIPPEEQVDLTAKDSVSLTKEDLLIKGSNIEPNSKYELNQCPKCLSKDHLVFSNNKVICTNCNSWAYIEDAVDSSWLKKVEE